MALGVVETFSDERGDGVILGDDGRRYYLHCVEVADGTRHVEPRARVSFVARPGQLGRDEAAAVQVVDVADDADT
jgi:cold shock CspA family protein